MQSLPVPLRVMLLRLNLRLPGVSKVQVKKAPAALWVAASANADGIDLTSTRSAEAETSLKLKKVPGTSDSDAIKRSTLPTYAQSDTGHHSKNSNCTRTSLAGV